MNILFLGDIVGRAGRDIVFKHLAQLQHDHKIDVTIINAENSAHGKGITQKIYKQLMAAGCDIVTLGNHAYSKSEIKDHIRECEFMIQPYNHLCQMHQGYKIIEVKGLKLCVCNILGTALMHDNNQDAFSSMEDILDETDADLYFVDFHAEATSEKILFANYFRDRIHTVVGTHTHVQTADERIIGQLAYITDAGMCGVYDSVIGRDTEEMIDNVIHGEHTHYQVASGPAILCGCVITIDEEKLVATNIERIQIRPSL